MARDTLNQPAITFDWLHGVTASTSTNTSSEVPVRQQWPLARHTLMRIGGPARVFLPVHDTDQVCAGAAWIRDRGETWYVLGNGSNLVVADAGIDAAVLGWRCRRPLYRLDGRVLTVQAGTSWPSVAMRMARAGLSGLEPGIGIPGTIGGSLCMHAGIPEGGIAKALRSVELLRMSDGRIFTFDVAAMQFGDRSSIMLVEHDWVALAATFDLHPRPAAEVLADMRAKMTHRRATQPWDTPNAGCVFRRESGVLPGRLIDQCGLKGLRVGDAEVSPLHANFIVNRGTASAADVDALARQVASEVYRQTGITLHREVQFVGEFDLPEDSAAARLHCPGDPGSG